MLKKSATIQFLLRFIGCWLIASLGFSLLIFIQSRLNYKYHRDNNWTFEMSKSFRGILQHAFLGFVVVWSLYYIGISKRCVRYLCVQPVPLKISGTIAEDFFTAGGIADDWASFSLAYRIVRFAWKLK